MAHVASRRHFGRGEFCDRTEVTTESTAVRQVHDELVKPERFVERNTFLGISGVTDFCFDARRWK